MQYSGRGFKSTNLHAELLLIHLERKSEVYELASLVRSGLNLQTILHLFLLNRTLQRITGTTGRFLFLFYFPGISAVTLQYAQMWDLQFKVFRT